MTTPVQFIRRFRANTDGAALVEFAFVLPVLLLFFAVIIEGSRTFWAYQTTVAGVRDATRFIARAQAADVCATGGSLTHWTDRAETIVRQSSSGADLFPPSVTVTSVTPSLACETGAFAQPTVPLATVTAQLNIDYPFASLFAFFNLSLPSAQTTIRDTSRIYGT